VETGEGLLGFTQSGSLDERKADGGVSGTSPITSIGNYKTDGKS